VSADEDSLGHKWSLTAAFRALALDGVDVARLQERLG